ncbi:MAG: sugar phosphate isomerase/epimerase [Verrucomicrobia bacterium]|jgi:sugar phosphate isomerase/epimerase|nr:sugar phosphate isomerase/epimerase [Verrucomicrobiota bacterium]|tara:strand:- start:16532 stop:17383 length:852 start_codon:yes stop_codon:yes gene_type:complete
MKTILTIAAAALAISASLHAEPIPENLRQEGWFIGAQAYTFKNFTAFEAIAKTKQAGGKMIEFYPGQKMKPDSKVKIHHTMPEEAMKELLAECKRQEVHAVNYGVIKANNADEVNSIMDFAKKMGLYAVCTESTEQIVAWEAAAIRTDIKVAFHEHGGSMSNPKYKVWNPLYILGVVESRDKRVGACADLGHWCTSNLVPVECLRILDGRVVSVHLKDKAKMGKSEVVVAGTGVVDVAACLEELKKQKFDGHISIEHENDWNDSVPQVKANIDFVKSHPKTER